MKITQACESWFHIAMKYIYMNSDILCIYIMLDYNLLRTDAHMHQFRGCNTI